MGYLLAKTLLQRSSPTVTDSFEVSDLKYGPLLTSDKSNFVSSSSWNEEWDLRVNFLPVPKERRYKKDI